MAPRRTGPQAPRRRRARAQGAGPRSSQGVVLIDVLVAVLVFAVGVLSLVALQSTAAQQSSQAKYRADATMLANALISQMWLTDRQVTTLQNGFATGGAAYEQWWGTVVGALPGAADFPPAVTVDSVAGGPGSPATARVTVTLQWRPPSAAATDEPNRLVMVTQIR